MDKGTILLLVEDNPDDVELTLRAMRKHNLANEIVVARDGVEALDYLFGTGAYEGRNASDVPHLVLLDLKLPKKDGREGRGGHNDPGAQPGGDSWRAREVGRCGRAEGQLRFICDAIGTCLRGEPEPSVAIQPR